jgi:hypothetical protein
LTTNEVVNLLKSVVLRAQRSRALNDFIEAKVVVVVVEVIEEAVAKLF